MGERKRGEKGGHQGRARDRSIWFSRYFSTDWGVTGASERNWPKKYRRRDGWAINFWPLSLSNYCLTLAAVLNAKTLQSICALVNVRFFRTESDMILKGFSQSGFLGRWARYRGDWDWYIFEGSRIIAFSPLLWRDSNWNRGQIERERERRNNNKHVRGYFPFAFRKNFIIFSFFASTQVGPALPSEYLRGILTGAQLLLMVLFFSFSSLSRETERDG